MRYSTRETGLLGILGIEKVQVKVVYSVTAAKELARRPLAQSYCK